MSDLEYLAWLLLMALIGFFTGIVVHDLINKR